MSSTARIKIQYMRRDEVTGMSVMRITTPDGSIITQAMFVGDVAHLELTASALAIEVPPAPTPTQGENFFARAQALAPDASTDDLVRLADFLSEHPELAS